MTRRRWIADEFSETRAALTGAHAAHLARTLRVRVGQAFEVACGDCVRLAVVDSVGCDRVEFVLGDQVVESATTPITLVLAIFKFDRMEWAIEKCTELNVTAIAPVIAQRTQKHLALAADKRVERWRRICREAAEQARRKTPPEIADPMRLNEALSCNAELPIVLAESERDNALSDLLGSHKGVRSLALAVGPEGGWTPRELQAFRESQWIFASLGHRILRAETAAIVALAIARS